MRHTRPTEWLNDGIPPAQAAECACDSVPVSPAIYARRACGQPSDLEKRMGAGGDPRELPEEGGACAGTSAPVRHGHPQNPGESRTAPDPPRDHPERSGARQVRERRAPDQ
jgi:hypothetical protein